jgi:hypothetical protein
MRLGRKPIVIATMGAHRRHQGGGSCTSNFRAIDHETDEPFFVAKPESEPNAWGVRLTLQQFW